MRVRRQIEVGVCLLGIVVAGALPANAVRKPHVVGLGIAKRVPYSKTGDPAGAAAGEGELKIRALLVDGVVKEWTTGEAHEVTDRSFVVRRVLRLNDSLPGEAPAPGAKASHWVWQRGPWLLVDRATGRITPLKLPDYAPAVSLVSWFRDYGAYCGVTASGKSLYAVVAQLAARKPILAKKLGVFDSPPPASTGAICGPPEWQRDPLRVTFHPAGRDSASFDIVLGSAILVEDSGDEADNPVATKPD